MASPTTWNVDRVRALALALEVRIRHECRHAWRQLRPEDHPARRAGEASGSSAEGTSANPFRTRFGLWLNQRDSDAGGGHGLAGSERLSTVLGAECAYVAAALVQAYMNTIEAKDFDAVRYARRLAVLQDRADRGDRTADIPQDEELTRYGPNCDKQDSWPEYGNVVVVDRHGVVLLWSLPHLLLPRRVKKMEDAYAAFSRASGRGEQPPESNPRRPGERQSAPEDATPLLETATFSPAYFQPGTRPRARREPTASPTLIGNGREAGLRFLVDMVETNALISAILSIIHPDQHYHGALATTALQGARGAGVARSAALWPSAFAALEVSARAGAPPPRRHAGAFDVIASVGGFAGGQMRFPTLPVDVCHGAGSVVALCAGVLTHCGVERVEGARLEFRWAPSDDVLAWAGEPSTPFCSKELVEIHIMDDAKSWARRGGDERGAERG